MRKRDPYVKVAWVTSLMAVSFALFANCLVGAANPPAVNRAPAVPGEQMMTNDISLLENRFFSRQFANDPLEKRLERLELMIFGASQSGANPLRFSRLSKVISDRGSQSAAQPTRQAPLATKEKELDSSTQYPILNTLEWRALKRTFAGESLDQRIARLETKLFGLDSPAMAYVDRVDRLKRTLGVGVVAQQPSAPLGPAPKARPRGLGNPALGDGSPNFFGGGTGTDADGFDEMPIPSFGNGALSRTFTDMFRDMDRQMDQLSKLGPGQWTFDSSSGTWTEMNSGRKIKPDGTHVPGTQTPGTPKAMPFKAPARISPRMNPWILPEQQRDSALPPYADPNSI